jgi:hypothetical protein
MSRTMPIHLYQIKNPKLAFRLVHDKDKIQRSIAPIHHPPPVALVFARAAHSLGAQKRLQLWGVEEVAECGWARADERKYFVDERSRGGLVERGVELG